MSESTPINEDDDLFNFDDMFRRAGKTPAVTVPAVAKPALVSSEALAASSALSARATPIDSPPPGQIAHVKPVVPKLSEALVTAESGFVGQHAASSRRPGAWTLAALLVAAAIQLAFVGIVWRSMSGVGDALREVGDRVAHANELTAAEGQAWQDLSAQAPAPDEGEVALTEAAEEIRQGEYERARARLYSLLSVIDHFDASQRANLASRAQVLAADAFREQADALERALSKAPETSGFIDLPLEKKP